MMRTGWMKAAGVGFAAAVMIGSSVTPASAVYPIVNPPSAPRDVVAVAGNASASVAWQVPATDGGSAISTYRVTSTPSSAGCLVPATQLTCEITGLTNGTSYTFSVSALNGAGFGAAGVSNAVTPQAEASTITISATRSGGTVFVTGTTENVPAGAVLSSFIRIEGDASFVAGPPASVGADGTFSWSATVPATKGVEVYVSYQGVDSNIASIAADAQTSLAIGGSRSGDVVSISGLSTNVPEGSSVLVLTRVNGSGSFRVVGSATVAVDGRFAFTGSQSAADQLEVVAEIGGLRSNILSFPGEDPTAILISGSRSANGRTVTVVGGTAGIPAGALMEPTVTLDGVAASGIAVQVRADGGFEWQRRVGSGRTVTVFFTYAGVASNVVTLVPGQPSIAITGARFGGAIAVAGLTSSIDEGTSLTSYVRVEGDVGFTPGSPATVDADGLFTWSRPLTPTRGAEVYFVGGGATSNTVFIPASASSVVITGTRNGTTVTVNGLATGAEPGTEVTLRTRIFGDDDYATAGTTTVDANGAFGFTTTVALDQGVSLFVTTAGAESNLLTFNPLAASIVLFGGSFQAVNTSRPRIETFGQVFNVPTGSVVVPFVSLNGGPYTTGTGARTLNEQGDFTWGRRVGTGVTTVDVYFATAEGITSNTIRLTR